MKKIIWCILISLIVLSLVLASCGGGEEATEEEPVTEMVTPTEQATPTEQEKPTEKPVSSKEEPQYGGTFTYRIQSDPRGFDPYLGGSAACGGLYLETLCMRDWAIDREICDFRTTFTPLPYMTGRLAERWEVSPDNQTYTFYIRKGVYWQDLPPVNGRELDAYDIEYNWHRNLGLGSGFTEPTSYIGSQFALVASVTATDKWTVVFKLKEPSLDQLRMIVDSAFNHIVAREAVEKWGDVNDWKHAIGTGPFILTDFVSGSSLTYIKNPNYWGYDKLYPENRLPYIDNVKFLIIPDDSTAFAAVRTGKIAIVEGISWEQAKNFERTNPELMQATRPQNSKAFVLMTDKKPFNDIRVRRAMQMSIDRETIAKTYYGSTVDPTPMGLSGLKGYYTPFEEWPEEVKEGYTYNPEGAKQLLTEAGYTDGFKCTLTVSSSEEMDLCQIVQAYLAEIGIDMEIEVMEPVVWRSYVRASKHEIMVDSGTYVTYPPVNMLNQYYSGHARAYSYDHVSDPYYDELWMKAKTSVDEEELRKTVIEADRYSTAKQWRINLFPTVNYCVYQPWLKRFNGEIISFADVVGQMTAQFWIDEDLKKAIGH